VTAEAQITNGIGRSGDVTCRACQTSRCGTLVTTIA